MRVQGSPSGHQLSVALRCETGQDGVRTDLRGSDSSVAEARVQVAVHEVALDPKRVRDGRYGDGASEGDLSARCDRERRRLLFVRPIGHDDAVVSETWIQLPVGEVTRDSE